MLRYLLLLLFLVLMKPCSAQYFDTLHIHYDIGVARLQQKDKSILDSLAKYIGSRKMLIYSYADYLGSERPNQHLSDNRANEVKGYLLKKGIPSGQIMECTGLGMIKGSGSSEGDVTFRRTDIFIRKKDIPVAKADKPVTRTSKAANPKSAENNTVSQAQPGPIPVKQAKESEVALRIARKVDIPPGKVTQIKLDSLKVDQTLNLENMMFFPGSPDLMPSSYSEFDNLYNVMRDNPDLKIRLEGHVCCCVYPDGYFEDTPTWGLSVERAFRIYKQLVNRGIAPERMQYKGFGRTKPIRDNEHTVAEGAANRRVEIRILAK